METGGDYLLSVESRPPAFAFFDHIYVINLDRDTDRMSQMARRLTRQGISFERFAAQSARGDEICPANPSLPPEYFATAASHRAVLCRAIAQGSGHILIFEDDVVLRDDTSEKMREVLQQLDSVSWDVLHLGLHLIQDGGSIAENIGIVKRGFHSHAYAVNRSALPKVVAIIDRAVSEGWHYDALSDPSLIRLYVKPILAIQEPGESRVLGKPINRFREYFPPFDESEFLEHCLESRRWGSKTQKRAPETLRQTLANAKELHRLGNVAKAQQLYEELLEQNPDDPEINHFLGLLYHQQGKGTLAVDLLYRSLADRPDSYEFLSNIGMVLAQTGRFDEAIEALDRAIELKSDYADAHFNKGVALAKLSKVDEAIGSLLRTIELKPDSADAHSNLGSLLTNHSDLERGLKHLRRAVSLNPRNADAQNNLGIALRRSSDIQAATAAFRAAIEARPNFAGAYANLGAVLNEQGRPVDAISYFDKAIELRPDFIEAHWSLSLALLASGEFERGWLEYEWRRHLAQDQVMKRGFLQPEWNGSSISGRTILVLCEQGLGDTLQFIRYVSLLAKRGARVVVECQAPLRRLLTCMEDVVQVIARGEPLPRFDTYVRLLSLPGIFGTRPGHIPAEGPYLMASGERVEYWKSRLSAKGLRIGVSWQGNPNFPTDRWRSIPLEQFELIAKLDRVHLFSLQKNAGEDQLAKAPFKVEVFDPPLDVEGAFVDTAAVMANLDLVITSDTAIAHLAGALGIQVWVILAFNCDWRWLRDRNDSPWYPTMKLFRQDVLGDWSGVFKRLHAALLEMDSQPACKVFEPLAVPLAPAELLDRLCILEIKARKFSDPEKLRNVRREQERLTTVRESAIPRDEQLDRLVAELAEVNELLWNTEDEIRLCDRKGDFGPIFIELSRRVYRTNDQRADLKRRINSHLSANWQDEKLYQAYLPEISPIAD